MGRGSCARTQGAASVALKTRTLSPILIQKATRSGRTTRSTPLKRVKAHASIPAVVNGVTLRKLIQVFQDSIVFGAHTSVQIKTFLFISGSW